MSSYLTFYVNKDIPICTFSRNTEFYEECSFAPFNELEKVTPEMLRRCRSNIADSMDGFEKAIKRQEWALDYLQNTEEIYEAINTITSMKETLEELNTCLLYINFLEDLSDMNKGELYWGIF